MKLHPIIEIWNIGIQKTSSYTSRYTQVTRLLNRTCSSGDIPVLWHRPTSCMVPPTPERRARVTLFPWENGSGIEFHLHEFIFPPYKDIAPL